MLALLPCSLIVLRDSPAVTPAWMPLAKTQYMTAAAMQPMAIGSSNPRPMIVPMKFPLCRWMVLLNAA
ncbi:hypothetical protein AVKW3434_22850 [Acidovorax sp. SUPP3434]|nr:hypothetical protein AVKW3434_22850 [Acidovorax sp. SUPP3434]